MLKKICYLLSVSLVLTTPGVALEPGQTKVVVSLDDCQFQQFIQSAEKPVIVDFWASWCGPCMRVKPLFEEVAQELKEDYLFVTVNVDQSPELVARYEIEMIPTFKVIKKGEVVGTFSGGNKEYLIESIRNSIEGKVVEPEPTHEPEVAFDGKLTEAVLLDAVKKGSKDLVAACLASKEIDVNKRIEIDVLGLPMQNTALWEATMLHLFYRPSFEIVEMLLRAGANPDVELVHPIFDEEQKFESWHQITARQLIENTAIVSDEKIAQIENEAFRHVMMQSKAEAIKILKLL